MASRNTESGRYDCRQRCSSVEILHNGSLGLRRQVLVFALRGVLDSALLFPGCNAADTAFGTKPARQNSGGSDCHNISVCKDCCADKSSSSTASGAVGWFRTPTAGAAYNGTALGSDRRSASWRGQHSRRRPGALAPAWRKQPRDGAEGARETARTCLCKRGSFAKRGGLRFALMLAQRQGEAAQRSCFVASTTYGSSALQQRIQLEVLLA